MYILEHNDVTITVFEGDITSIPLWGFVIYGPFGSHMLAYSDNGDILPLNVGLGSLGTAASKDVGTGAGQIPDMSAWPGSYGASEAAGTWYKMPNGIIVQEGLATPNGHATITLPIPFTSRILSMAATKNQGHFTPYILPNGSSLSTFLLGSANGEQWSTGDQIHWRLEGI